MGHRMLNIQHVAEWRQSKCEKSGLRSRDIRVVNAARAFESPNTAHNEAREIDEKNSDEEANKEENRHV